MERTRRSGEAQTKASMRYLLKKKIDFYLQIYNKMPSLYMRDVLLTRADKIAKRLSWLTNFHSDDLCTTTTPHSPSLQERISSKK